MVKLYIHHPTTIVLAVIIGIGGVSRSGKTHLSHDIVWHFRQQNKRAIAVRLDDFVKEINKIPTIKGETDWEVPASIDYSLAIAALDFYALKFQIVIIEGHLVYAETTLAKKIDVPFLLQTNISTYKRRKAADTRWGEIPEWYNDYIWEAFSEHGAAHLKEPIYIKADYPAIDDVKNYLQNI